MSCKSCLKVKKLPRRKRRFCRVCGHWYIINIFSIWLHGGRICRGG